MSCFELVAHYAEKFRSILSEDATANKIPEFPWKNNVWSSFNFRKAHVQEFITPNIVVLHVTVFPHLHNPSPIYGFDIITGIKKPSGCYLDISPSAHKWDGWSSWIDTSFGERKPIPDWADIFSSEFVAVAPSDEKDLEKALKTGLFLLISYLMMLELQTYDPSDVATAYNVYEAQKNYCEKQRLNKKTVQMLERMIGEEMANQFVTEVLYPLPEKP
jgi:phycocyanobilin:ferredoxin oxidoreductase